MRTILLSFVFIVLMTGCRTTPDACTDPIPVRFFESEPLYTGAITTQSHDAAIIYLAIADQLKGAVSTNSHTVDLDDPDRFYATKYDDDEEDSDTYASYLASSQSLFEIAFDASQMSTYYNFPDSDVIYWEINREDPRRLLGSSYRFIALTLADDAVRHWHNGDRDLALKRLRTIIQMGIQTQLHRNRYTHISLVSVASAHVALNRLQILIADDLDELSPALIRDAQSVLQLVEGDDPLGMYCHLARVSRSQQAWLEDQLSTEGGTFELWYVIGQLHGVHQMTSQMFSNILNPNADKNDDGKLSVNEILPTEDELIETILTDLDGVTFDQVRDTFNELSPLCTQLIHDLHSGKPDFDALRELREYVQDDETMISDLLNLSVADPFCRRNRDFLQQRDELIKLLASQ